MSSLHSFELIATDGKLIRGDRSIGQDRQILFITGFLSKRWGNKSKALVQWCEEKGWGFCCYDVRGFGESGGNFTDYTLSDWIADARTVLRTLDTGPPLTLVGNSLGGWIAWLMAQELEQIERLVLIAPAFNMMGLRAKSIDPERRQAWQGAGWMPWDDEPAHKDWPLAWKWVEESEAYWKASFDRLRQVHTTILHGLQDSVILPGGSRQFVEQLLAKDVAFPVELNLVPGDHRLSSPENVEQFHQLVVGQP
ncbi:MAG: alpha/beta fold hydrolase [Nitrospiraceae bacterium]|jgi:pimeloyl-ACP methyl ester carboxylesterase|nr:alpha/beta fold hydrolase [Nitrospiraceae bacterium]